MEETVTNHSDAQEPVIETTNTESAPAETVTTPEPTEQPKGITVKYNKEDKFVTEDEIPQWVQKGLNYDKVSERAKQAETLQQNLDRVAKFYGYDSHDTYMKALEEAEIRKQIEAEADRLGVDPSVIQEYVQPMKNQVQSLEQKLKTYEQQEMKRRIDAEIDQLKQQYPDFEQRRNDVFSLALERGYTLEDAYVLLTHREQLDKARLQAEQDALLKLKQNADSSTGALGADAPEEKTGYMSMTPAERRAFREKVKRGDAVI